MRINKFSRLSLLLSIFPSFDFALLLFQLYRKNPPSNKKIPIIKYPINISTTTGVLFDLSGCDIGNEGVGIGVGVGVGFDVGVDVVVGVGVGSGNGDEGSKRFVHIYSSSLLIS